MQHWTFLEALAALSKYSSALQFVDAYSMAPLAKGPTRPDRHFISVRDAKRRDISPYVRLWEELVDGQADRYPSSAAFAVAAWPERLTLELYEQDLVTYRCIRRWLHTLPNDRVRGEVHEGDWRNHFRGGLCQAGDFSLISFDPNLFDWRGRSKKGDVMGPADLLLLFDAVGRFTCPVLVQISTYSANGPNKMVDVSRTWAQYFGRASFQAAGLVQANGHNMSALFGLRLPEKLEKVLSSRICTGAFKAWLTLARTPAD